VSNEVSADEVGTLLTDDLTALEEGVKEYDEDLCKSINDAIEKFRNLLDYCDSLGAVVIYLDGVGAALNSRDPVDLATAISNAQDAFQQALGTCVQNLETIHWIIEQIANIFCDEGK
jgi:hypothetical protein